MLDGTTTKNPILETIEGEIAKLASELEAARKVLQEKEPLYAALITSRAAIVTALNGAPTEPETKPKPEPDTTPYEALPSYLAVRRALAELEVPVTMKDLCTFLDQHGFRPSTVNQATQRLVKDGTAKRESHDDVFYYSLTRPKAKK